MTLRTKVLWTNAALLGGMLLVLHAASSKIVFEGFEDLEHNAIRQNLARVRGALDHELAGIDRTLRDWSAWDDTCDFIADPADKYIESNLADETLANIAFDTIAFVDATGTIVFHKACDPSDGTAVPTPAGFMDALLPGSPLLYVPDTESRVLSLLATPEGLLLVGARPIIQSNLDGPVRGALVAGRYLTADRIEVLAQPARLTVEVRSLAGGPLPPEFDRARSQLTDEHAIALGPERAASATGYSLLNDVYGRPAAIVSASEPCTICVQARNTWDRYVAVLLTAGLVFGGLATVLVQRLVVERLASLNATVTAVTASGDLAARVTLRGQDEIASLAAAVNGLLARIQRSQEELRAHHAELRVANRELAQARDAAETANVAKSAFLANMSHEIRTPLTAISGFAELIAEDIVCCDVCPVHVTCTRREDCRQYTEAILTNGRHLLGLINDILDLSKIEANKLVVECLPVSPRHLLAEVQSLLSVRAAQKGLTLEVVWEGPIPERIQTDPTRLRQILLNLIGNAIKFTARGRVRVTGRVLWSLPRPDAAKSRRDLPDASGSERATLDGPWLQLDVQDTGVGLSPAQLDHLFQPFTQADTSITRRFGGSGLGLVISKRLAEALGGDIAVRSTLGRASTFSVTVATGPLDGVPLLAPGTEHAVFEPGRAQPDRPPGDARACPSTPPSPALPPAPRITLSGRILLVEDGPDNQRLIGLFLERAGASVTVAENGSVAVDRMLAAIAGLQPYTLVLMDMQMPVMDGYAATQHLRQLGYNGPIIALTAHAMSGDRDKCVASGCDDFLTKPINRQHLLACVHQHIAAHGSARTS